ncbi:ATP-dependent 6-phosphofructokinase [Calycomorphotria hydatis]|uniref:ATP-dependent 6-phosphofructokinase n=1 Tax=Calycomorphotria hydatis TaxID=2528027 RepID=A0A517TBY8_9PLAN|nr:ATP-dependent 6-phosphofructokinase [Calycomorphotria hydatis]QDT65883.1 6-phosphofructokinase 1 [Calycomorphotria hydatis]
MSNLDSSLDVSIRTLGPCTVDSPVGELLGYKAKMCFMEEHDQILVNDALYSQPADPNAPRSAFELAGPREKIFFEPSQTKVGIVTCGGLCPGLNEVVRGLVMVCWHRYGVRTIKGFRFGYRGIAQKHAIDLTPEMVDDTHDYGGTLLGSSRGGQDVDVMVDNLVEMGIEILFVVGGDGTIRGAQKISEAARHKGARLAVVGVPKTIDNDISYVDRSFGFDTAYATAIHAIRAAHEEARGALNGVGVVKLMGRHSGFIACYATLACSDVNFTLIPEIPVILEGEGGFLATLKRRLESRQHSVVVIAEGACQTLMQNACEETDASGNVRLLDVGPFFVNQINKYLTAEQMEFTVKYIDPSYIIRSVPPNPSDSVYCWRLAQNAVHAAMCGKTEMIVSQWHGQIVHVPMLLAISERKLVDPTGDLWLSVLESTGQPVFRPGDVVSE